MDNLTNLKSKITLLWKKNLKSKGVKFPSGSKLIELICLFNHMPSPISQDEIEKWHLKNGKEYKRQARHLADAGWFIKSGNSNLFFLTTESGLQPAVPEVTPRYFV